MTNNAERASRARFALKSYMALHGDDSEPTSSNAADLIADLLHLVASLEPTGNSTDVISLTLQRARLQFAAEHE